MTDPRGPDMSGARMPEGDAFEQQMAIVLDDMGEPDPRFDAMSIVRIATAKRLSARPIRSRWNCPMRRNGSRRWDKNGW